MSILFLGTPRHASAADRPFLVEKRMMFDPFRSVFDRNHTLCSLEERAKGGLLFCRYHNLSSIDLFSLTRRQDFILRILSAQQGEPDSYGVPW